MKSLAIESDIEDTIDIGYLYLIVYDFEAFLCSVEAICGVNDTIVYRPTSIAVASNIPKYDIEWFCLDTYLEMYKHCRDPRITVHRFVETFLEYCTDIANTVIKLMFERYERFIIAL
jgi:hypothetical protein